MFDIRPVETDYVRHRAAQFRDQVVRRLDGSRRLLLFLSLAGHKVFQFLRRQLELIEAIVEFRPRRRPLRPYLPPRRSARSPAGLDIRVAGPFSGLSGFSGLFGLSGSTFVLLAHLLVHLLRELPCVFFINRFDLESIRG